MPFCINALSKIFLKLMIMDQKNRMERLHYSKASQYFADTEIVNHKLTKLLALDINEDESADCRTSSEQSAQQYRILVIDDEPDVALCLKVGLENEEEKEGIGFAVDTFNDPTEALSNFKPGVYDLLLMDIRMRKMNGFELYRRMKEIDHRVKVCFLTASETYYDDELKREFPKLDIRCFVSKPVTTNELSKVIKEQLKKGTSPL
jgi:CheY-like chemotaxis protein